jgi:tetratricopeptide (TPR) repeat protein
MVYDIIAPFVFLASVAGILVIVVRKLPVAANGSPAISPGHAATDYIVAALRFVRTKLLEYLNQFWKFLQEVKELPTASTKFPSFIRHSRDRFHISAAESYLTQGRFPEAEEAFLAVLKKDPMNRRAYEGLGRLYFDQEQFGEAAEVYKFLLHQEPNNASYHASHGRALYGCKKFAEAKEAFLSAIRLDPNIAHRYVNLGLCHVALEELVDAAAAYEKAVELDPTNTQYLMLLADSLLTQGMQERGEELLEKILELDPTHHDAREKLMQVKFAGNDETK